MGQEQEPIRALLTGGDRRSIGDAARVVTLIAEDPRRFGACVAAIADDDPLVRMRAADAVEKASRDRPALLAPHKAALLGPLAAIAQQEVRWHLLQLWPRLPLTAAERGQAFAFATAWLAGDSRIVAADALSAMFALAADDASLRARAAAAAEAALTAPAPSLRTRARKLLREAR